MCDGDDAHGAHVGAGGGAGASPRPGALRGDAPSVSRRYVRHLLRRWDRARTTACRFVRTPGAPDGRTPVSRRGVRFEAAGGRSLEADARVGVASGRTPSGNGTGERPLAAV